MDEGHADSDKLSIRCPGCGQRFKVGLDLRDRMVECGTCEHRFRVNDEVIVRQKKFYPGERRDVALDRFSRIPKGASGPTNFQTIQYSPEPAPNVMPSSSPLRPIFGFLAVAAVVVVALMLIFGGSPGGMLDGATQVKRLMLAGFTALIAAVFFVAANPQSRVKAIIGASLSAALLVALPFFFTEGNVPVKTSGAEFTVRENAPGSGKPEEAVPENSNLEALKSEIGTDPLDREIKRYQSPANAGRGAAGIWLRDMRDFYKLEIRSYIIRATGADESSHLYRRDSGYLLVVSGVTEDLAELARLCERFGEVKRIIEPLRVIEVGINNESFTEGPLNKLNDPGDPAYYELNRRELESIDLERARNAINRIAEVEPKLYRKDIASRLRQLLKEGDVEMQGQIARALMVWGEEGDGSDAAVFAAVQKMSPQAGEVPENMIKLLAARKFTEAIPFVDQLWAGDFTKWEELYGAFGPPIEDKVLTHFETGSSPMKRSAARLLGKTGSAKSIPVLEAARKSADPELTVFIERAVTAIKARN